MKGFPAATVTPEPVQPEGTGHPNKQLQLTTLTQNKTVWTKQWDSKSCVQMRPVIVWYIDLLVGLNLISLQELFPNIGLVHCTFSLI